MWNTDAINGPETVDPDRLKSWNQTNLEKGSGTFYFSLTWRSTLSGVFSRGLSLYNFRAKNSLLSFRTTFVTAQTTYATVSLDIFQKEVKILYLAFSVIIVESSSSRYLYFATCEKRSVRLQNISGNLYIKEGLSISSSFMNYYPYIHVFPQWFTFRSHPKKSINAEQRKTRQIVSMKFEKQLFDYYLKIPVEGSAEDLTGIKVHILVITKNISVSYVN